MIIVVALGGNAIQPRGETGSISKQRERIRGAAGQLAQLAAAGHDLVVTHGNGPQVGRLMLQDEAMTQQLPRYPLDVHVAETQGQLGYLIQQELSAALARAGAPRTVVTIVTQVVVDPADPAFARPTKPVGPYLSAKGASEHRARGAVVTEVPGGWRRVVPSPEPAAIVEGGLLRALIAAGAVPIAAGGGGIPVVRENGLLRGVEAVIDKDLAAAVLAEAVAAELLLILTDVEHVERNFGTSRAEPIRRMTAAEARAGVADGEFPRGSMAEKVIAAGRTAERGARAVITSLDRGLDAIAGAAGTEVVLG